MNDTKIITNQKIKEKLEKKDKNNNDYLILKLENQETIFVFDSKVKEDRWGGLREDEQEYNFTVEEGNNGSNLLIDFEIKI